LSPSTRDNTESVNVPQSPAHRLDSGRRLNLIFAVKCQVRRCFTGGDRRVAKGRMCRHIALRAAFRRSIALDDAIEGAG
jgi:hypothetical protein